MADEDALTPTQQIYSCLLEGKEREAIDLFKLHPELVNSTDENWLHEAARYRMLHLADFLIAAGMNVNSVSGIGQSTPLDRAVSSDEVPERFVFVEALLNRGANPNLSRTLITAINPRTGDENVSLVLVRLLVEKGRADVNRVYDVYGDPNNTFTAVEWAESQGRHKIAAYLRSKGAIDRPPQPVVPPPSAKKKRKT